MEEEGVLWKVEETKWERFGKKSKGRMDENKNDVRKKLRWKMKEGSGSWWWAAVSTHCCTFCEKAAYQSHPHPPLLPVLNSSLFTSSFLSFPFLFSFPFLCFSYASNVCFFHYKHIELCFLDSLLFLQLFFHFLNVLFAFPFSFLPNLSFSSANKFSLFTFHCSSLCFYLSSFHIIVSSFVYLVFFSFSYFQTTSCWILPSTINLTLPFDSCCLLMRLFSFILC